MVTELSGVQFGLKSYARFQNGSNKVAIELQVVEFWSEIIPVISNRTRTARSFDFEISRMISNQIALHSVQLPFCKFQTITPAFRVTSIGDIFRDAIFRHAV